MDDRVARSVVSRLPVSAPMISFGSSRHSPRLTASDLIGERGEDLGQPLGAGRLIDGYAEGVIERAEFEPRVGDLRNRVAQLEGLLKELSAAAEMQRDLTLIVGHFEAFSTHVRENLDLLDWSAKRDVIRLMVRRAEIDDGHIQIVFRIPPLPPSGPGQADDGRNRQRCMGERRTDDCLAQSLPPLGQGLGEPEPESTRFRPARLDPPHASKALQTKLNFPDRHLLSARSSLSHGHPIRPHTQKEEGSLSLAYGVPSPSCRVL